MTNKFELIALLKNNDQSTIKKIFEENRQSFILFAKQYKIDIHDAMDIYQDAIIVLINNAKKGLLDDLNSSLKSYLFGIGKFMFFKNLKAKSKINSTENFENMVVEMVEYNEDEYNLQVITIEKALQKLGEKCQKVLKLFYYEQKKIDEIQEILSYSNKDVLKSQKSRCLKQLKELTKIV